MPTSSLRAPYIAKISEFLGSSIEFVLGHLSKAAGNDVTTAQKNAWVTQIEILQNSLCAHQKGFICFEFTIPRIGKRADNIIYTKDNLFIIEFKVGATEYTSQDRRQVMDYALDMKNFHAGSHNLKITPILVATHAGDSPNEERLPLEGVYPTALANQNSLQKLLSKILDQTTNSDIDCLEWLNSSYKPTPTIIEASKALYSGHSVEEITHTEAGADNLGATTAAITEAIENAKKFNKKVIVLVSGVPGAGKTLAGLNFVYQRHQVDKNNQEHAVFLSGNGPLVKVLQEALARDEVARHTEIGRKIHKNDALRKATAFIQNVHHFRDEYLEKSKTPLERVVVFDEAQRAWDKHQASKFMRQKRNQPDFDQSEPDFLIDVMDRHEGWAAIVCLIGGGQEINTGEAGLEEWLRALRDKHPHWEVHLPPQTNSKEYLPNFQLAQLDGRAFFNDVLHLGVSLRSFRAERLSTAIGALMSADTQLAQTEIANVLSRFPIFITRSLAEAKSWARQQARGSERIGLLASSGAKRLKPLGIHMEIQIDPCMWFLNDSTDVRSSHYLEDAASEFDVQGLELDWSIVVWDADLTHQGNDWMYRAFKGTRWQSIHSADAQRYLLNSYRVLLTRARQGMVIVIPEGDVDDPTRNPCHYNSTWEYLLKAGIPILDQTAKQIRFTHSESITTDESRQQQQSVEA